MLIRATIGAALLTAALCYVQPASAADDAAHARCADAFDASQRLSQGGKLQEALEKLLVCAQPTCPAFLSRECTDDYERIKLNLPTVTLVANDAHGAPLAEVVVSVDGKRVADHIAGLATPIDPGLHDFAFEHTGDAPVTLKVFIAEGERKQACVRRVRRYAAIFAAASHGTPCARFEASGTHDAFGRAARNIRPWWNWCRCARYRCRLQVDWRRRVQLSCRGLQNDVH